MKILVLHRRMSGYFVGCLNRLVNLKVQLEIVAWPNQADAPFSGKVLENFRSVRNRNEFSDSALLQMAEEYGPDIVLVAGWSDAGYVKVCRALKSKGVLIVSGCDTQWKGSLRQHIASAIAPWHVQQFIDVLWVSGERQRQLAAKLGYAGDRCWDGYYACDWNLFSAEAEKRFQSQRPESLELRPEETSPQVSSLKSQPSSLSSQVSIKSFAFVGRYAPVKGLDTLAEAYRIYSAQVESPWKLICAGKGECREQLIDAGAEDRGFIQPDDLPSLLAEASAFILPSRFEPWGVVVQEAAATGLPVIVSDICGAGVHLLRDRWNGRSFAAGDAAHLAECLLWMHQQSDEQLAELGRNSFELSKQYTPERWARTLIEGLRGLRAEG
ncbi:glycosyltransferase family 4 protein [Coraliomargarita algicola]|uniref:Glycosyltransferase family 4 protein n=1 Tax=Coraliomargarita algicola TaxID=3092156 RepID=A0ABZ0RI16_9BACT|nr:glycosyltransferase family 4 protein [Coraliomargarita sp. J2-16]WPJ95011.1 glycosyltransferase family 4 protein [Coraliomargarita sp. J2-16]